MRAHRFGWVSLLCATVASCTSAERTKTTYFDERIAPILEVGCVQQTTGCHLASPQGTAPGNLDLSTYAGLLKREDVLHPYGPYAVPLLLMKGGSSISVPVETFGPEGYSGPANQIVNVTTDIRHAAGAGVALDSSGYAKLLQWMEDGYSESGAPRLNLRKSEGECRQGVGAFPGFDAASDPGGLISSFVSDVQPVLVERCAGSQCHGSPINNFYLSCGTTPEEQRWNYFVTLQYVTDPVETSELLRRPLAVRRGGSYHEGGDVFESSSGSEYGQLAAWAKRVVQDQPESLRVQNVSKGLRYFANRVQPVLVRKGCMFMGCHSPSMFHDLRFRGGSEGVFSRTATLRNYEAAKLQLAYDSDDANQSRLIAKNLFPSSSVPGARGLVHRGGSLLEDFSPTSGNLVSAQPEFCSTFDADAGDINQIPAYCIMTRWHQIERQEALAKGELRSDPLEMVWVQRPKSVGSVLDFDVFRGGARLMKASIVTDPNGAASLAGIVDLGQGCVPSGADIRNPSVSWDGSTIAFAARASADQPLRLYQVQRDGSGCAPIEGIASAAASQNGLSLHDFDPAWAPDGRLIFASTRGGEAGPRRTSASLAPNADLYIASLGTNASVRRLTYLSNQEVAPSVMADGRLIFTTEKREQDFHQLAIRRQNLDGGDYHPLYAQRPSVGFAAATEVVEIPNRNFVFVAGAISSLDGAGSLISVNRSIGPDQADRDGSDRYYQKAVSVLRPATNGNAYRSPAPLPDGRIVYACASDVTDPNASGLDFDLCLLTPSTGAETKLTSDNATSDVDGVVLFSRANHGVAPSRIDEANGRVEFVTKDSSAVVEFLDFPMLATLLFSNTRVGRPIDDRIGGFEVFITEPPGAEIASFSMAGDKTLTDSIGPMFASRKRIGYVPLLADGSAKVRIPGDATVVLRLTDRDGKALSFPEGAPFQGEMLQREEMQFYPGVASVQSFRRELFDGPCGVCHGSISNRELDVFVRPDVLTSASKTLSKKATVIDLSSK